MALSKTNVVIIGAGPYGLSLACHLRARNVEFRILGSPMRSWLNLPKGIALKSFDFATNIYTPKRTDRFVDYCRERGIDTSEPLDIAVFTKYGLWAQEELVPDVEELQVCHLEKKGESFWLELSNGDFIEAGRVVVSVGLPYFKHVPEELEGLPLELVSHTSDIRDYSLFRGKSVAVVGAGQSAIEAAALLHESGAKTQMLIRGAGLWFAGKMPEHRSLAERFKDPNSVAGPGRLNWFLEKAGRNAYFLPERRRVRLVKRHLGPFGTWWLKDQIAGKVVVHPGTTILGACNQGERLSLRVRDENGDREIVTDHVIAGTGYKPDVERIPFLAPELAARLDRIEKTPRLSRDFESSVPGLYFMGPITMFNFGPLVRFVCGAEFTAPAIAKHLARR